MDNSEKVILDLCGGTGAWSKPYADAGYDVRVITLPKDDVRSYVLPDEPIYGILAAPPCQMFSNARRRAKVPRNLPEAMQVVQACLNLIYEAQYRIQSEHQQFSPLKFWALENPYYGRLTWFMGKPAFTFDPYEFGDMYKKKTSLWGHFKEPVKTHFQKPDIKKFDALYAQEIRDLKSVTNDPNFWYNKKDRQTLRSITPAGFAKAFYEANQ